MSDGGAPASAPIPDRDFVAFVRGVGALMLIGASGALAVAQVFTADVAAFTARNALPPRGRVVMLLALVIGAVAGGAVSAVVYLPRRTNGGLERLGRLARWLAPLVLVGILPGFLNNEAWTDPLKLALCLGVFLLALEPLWRLHFGAYPDAAAWAREGWPRPPRFLAAAAARVRRLVDRVPPRVRRRLPAATVAAMAAFYILYMSFYTVRNHHRFNTFTWDLGQITNQFHNFLNGHPFRCTALIREGNWSELRNHAEATMFFLLPIYAIWPAAETLLIIQALLLGLAGVSLYRFAARRLSSGTALLLTAAYYLYPPLHGAQFFDIHFQPVAAAFLLAAIDCFDARRMRLFSVFFILAILCREDISVGTAVFGLFLMFTGHRVRAGVVIFFVSVAYFVLLRFVIMPAVGQWGFADHYKHLFPPGESNFAGIIRTIVTNPVFTFVSLLTAEKLRYLLQILLPLAFLPLRRPHLVLSILPGAYFTSLTTAYAPTLDIGFQYSGYFIPYIFPAAALALAAIARGNDKAVATAVNPFAAAVAAAGLGLVRRRAAVATLVAATVIATFHWGAIPPRAGFRSSYGTVSFQPPTPEMIQRRKDLHELNRMVPRDAILAVSDREMPHVANRVECWNISTGYAGSDYILYGKVNPIAPDTLQYEAALRAGYIRVAERPGAVLLKRPGAK